MRILFFRVRFAPPVVGFTVDRVAVPEWSILAGVDAPHEPRDLIVDTNTVTN